MILIDFEWLNILSILFFALSASSIIIAFDLYITTNFNKDPILDTSIEKYEDKYIKYISDMEEKDLSEDKLINLKKSIVLENTPMGNVVLFYHHEKEKFYYFSDRKDIPYKYLDTIARKYVKVFDCKIIYTLLSEELESQKKKYEEIKEERKFQKVEKKDKKADVFATYKNYNMKTDKPLKDEDYLIKENINKFKWGGFLKDYSFVQTQKKEVTELTYDQFVNTVNFNQNPRK